MCELRPPLMASVSLSSLSLPSRQSLRHLRMASLPSFESSALSMATALMSIMRDHASLSSNRTIISNSPHRLFSRQLFSCKCWLALLEERAHPFGAIFRGLEEQGQIGLEP